MFLKKSYSSPKYNLYFNLQYNFLNLTVFSVTIVQGFPNRGAGTPGGAQAASRTGNIQ